MSRLSVSPADLTLLPPANAAKTPPATIMTKPPKIAEIAASKPIQQAAASASTTVAKICHCHTVRSGLPTS